MSNNKDIELYIYFGWKCDDRNLVDREGTQVEKSTNNPDNRASQSLIDIFCFIFIDPLTFIIRKTHMYKICTV